MANYISLSREQRLNKFMTAALGAGVPVRHAVIVAAVASQESGYLFKLPREEPLRRVGCWPERQILMLEDGNPALGTIFPSRWRTDAEIMSFLTERGFSTDGRQLARQYNATDGAGGVPNNVLAEIFEFMIDRRKAHGVAAFSMGPTQAYLMWSPMVRNPGVPGRFTSWQQLWDIYTSTSVTTPFELGWYDYLKTNVVGFPMPGARACGNPDDATCVEYYLSRYQTGTRDWTNATWSGYAQRFADAVNHCWNVAYAINPNAA